MIGVLASVVGLFLGLGLAKGLFSLFDAGRLHAAEQRPHRSRPARSSSRSLVGIARHADRQPAARDPRDARAADRRRARGRDAAAVALRALPHDRLDRCSPALGFAALALRALRRRPRHDAGSCVWMGVGALLIFIGVAMFAVARSCSRFARVARLARDARSAAPPGSLARDNARRNPQRTASTASALMIGLALVTLVAVLAAGITHELPRRRRQDLAQRRLRDHGAEQLHADPDRGRERRREEPGRRGGRQRAHRRRARVRQRRSSRPAVNPAGEHDVQPRLESRARSDDGDARRRRRVRRQGLREEPPPDGRARRSC